MKRLISLKSALAKNEWVLRLPILNRAKRGLFYGKDVSSIARAICDFHQNLAGVSGW
jgi:hypothetical protein